MYIVRIFIIRLLMDSSQFNADCELRGSVLPVATQELHLFEDSTELLALLRSMAQEGGPGLDRKPDHMEDKE